MTSTDSRDRTRVPEYGLLIANERKGMSLEVLLQQDFRAAGTV
jgi:hypothetical protein